MLDTLLFYENHHKLRVEGLRLFLLVLADEHDIVEVKAMYRSIVHIQIFPEAEDYKEISNYCIGDDEKGILASSLKYHHASSEAHSENHVLESSISSRSEKLQVLIPRVRGSELEDGVELISILLENIVQAATNRAENISRNEYSRENCKSLVGSHEYQEWRFNWDMFKETIFVRFFPKTSEMLGMQRDTSEGCISNLGFSACPTAILAVLIKFICQITANTINYSENMTPKEFAIALIYEYLMNNEVHQEFVNEIVRQSLLFSGKDQTGQSIISSWVLASVSAI